MKLLVVDDRRESRDLIRQIMKAHGHDIVEASSGEEALRSFAACKPDCVLMDVEMQGMDGIAATRLLKREYPNARIIMVTLHDSPRLRTAAREAGATGYLPKEHLHELPALLTAEGFRGKRPG